MRREDDKMNTPPAVDRGREEARVPRLPKLTGADSELANFVDGVDLAGGTCAIASRSLIRQIDGLPGDGRHRTSSCLCDDCRARRTPVPTRSTGGLVVADSGIAGGLGALEGLLIQQAYNPQDWNRRFLPANGGCVYIDLDHLELCIPEVLSAYDHVAAWHAMLRIARGALVRANAARPPGRKIQVLVNNSDGCGHSYGSHLNFLVTRRAWSNIFDRRMHYLLFLAAYQVSSIVFTGQGKVGSENGAPAASFQLSQRADFFERLTGIHTTFTRPIVNSRDEPLCGSEGRRSRWGVTPEDDAKARLHVIFFDNTLSHVATLLKVGVMQIILAMIEAEQINIELILDDPLDALQRWSHDPSLRAKAPMVSGEKLTAVELQLRYLEEATRFVAGGGCEGIVPRAEEILALWQDTVVKLAAGEISALVPRLDWALKLSILERVMGQRKRLAWTDPEIKHLDLAYSNLDLQQGLYWSCEGSGLVERVADETAIERYRRQPPEETRAWARAMLLRRAGPGWVADVDWDSIRFRTDKGESGLWTEEHRTLDMPDPLALTREEAGAIILEREAPLVEILDALVVPHQTTKGEEPHGYS
jgi:proteasome accessory factor A